MEKKSRFSSRKNVLILLMVFFVVFALTEAVHAASPPKAGGMKLVGYSMVSCTTDINNEKSCKGKSYTINNPDCQNSVTIKHVSITNAGGNSVYEGSFLDKDGAEISALAPHEITATDVVSYPVDLDSGRYTVEVWYETQGSGLDPIGVVLHNNESFTPMYNLKQLPGKREHGER